MKMLHKNSYKILTCLLFYVFCNQLMSQCIITKREVNVAQSGFGNVSVPDGLCWHKLLFQLVVEY